MSFVSSPFLIPVNITVSGMWRPVGRIADEPLIGKDLKGNDRDAMNILFRHLLGATEENHPKPQVMVASVPAEIQSKDFTNVNQ
jgi:hypothetical protein